MKLVSKPKLLILDEPTAGMNPTEVSFFVDFINELRKEIAIVIIEHSIKVITTISDNIAVLNEGVKIAEGPPNDVINNKAVIEAYIGRR
jgi:branched-chain amino acid transport system ATP-binding protein